MIVAGLLQNRREQGQNLSAVLSCCLLFDFSYRIILFYLVSIIFILGKAIVVAKITE